MDEISLQDMENQESDKPPSKKPRPAGPWRVAVIANVKGETALPFNGPQDAGAEFDRRETIQAIQAAIESDGHETVFLPADHNLPFALLAARPEICFNIAEGLGGDGREAQVPALLEMLGIPYTASRVLANAVGLDKTMTKRVWRDSGLPVADFQEFSSAGDPLEAHMCFPLFVKPSREGTGMGMDGGAIVHNERQLRKRVHWVVENYNQPALVEEYLPGREFTVGVLGRRDAAIYSPRPELYGLDGYHRFPVLEVDSSQSVTPGVYGHDAKSLGLDESGVPRFICPAPIPAAMAAELQELAIRAHNAVNGLDVSRVDMRLNASGRPCLIEINTLPGLTPDFSDLCVLAKAEGISYRDLILEILYLAASRYGMVTPVPLPVDVHALKHEYVPVQRMPRH